MSAPDATPFRTEIRVRFAEVDDARVVYYPRYLDYCHRAFEDFMEAGFGTPYAEIFQGAGVGYPAVNVQVDYHAPARFGDRLDVEVTCARIGDRSLTLRYRMLRQRDGALCCDARVTIASIDMATFSAIRVPDAHRAFFARHLGAPRPDGTRNGGAMPEGKATS